MQGREGQSARRPARPTGSGRGQEAASLVVGGGARREEVAMEAWRDAVATA